MTALLDVCTRATSYVSDRSWHPFPVCLAFIGWDIIWSLSSLPFQVKCRQCRRRYCEPWMNAGQYLLVNSPIKQAVVPA